MEFKDRLKHLLETKMINGKKVTAYKIGKNTTVSKASVTQYLNGTLPSIEKAKALATYLEVSVEWLLNGNDTSTENAKPVLETGFMHVP